MMILQLIVRYRKLLVLVKEPTGGNSMTTDEKITNMNILNRAVDWAIATGNLDDKAVLEQCKVYKEMLFKF